MAGPPRLARALREALREGYSWTDLKADLTAGFVVAAVAVPLSLAFAIASGVPPQYGLVTAIVAGLLTALLGGSRVQVTGPTAAFIVILAPIATQHGHRGLALAAALSGVVLVAMGLMRLGRLVQLMPYPVTIGFTAGVGVVIAILQIEALFGLAPPEGAGALRALERLATLADRTAELDPYDTLVGLLTLAALLAWRKVPTRLPAAIVALPLGALAALALMHWAPGAHVESLADRFGDAAHPYGIAATLPQLLAPWNLPDASGALVASSPLPSFALLHDVLPAAFAIAMLAALATLLSAVVADGMSGRTHDPDAELTALGIANIVAPFFGAIPASGAVARTITNVRSGARSPIAAIAHSLFVLAAVLTLAPALGHVPMASLAALLLTVAWNMAELPHIARVLRTAPRSDSAVLLVCLTLTVAFDMTTAVGVGVTLASFLFMRRMIELGGARFLEPQDSKVGGATPAGVAVYEIAGPLFFGAAHKATATLSGLDRAQTQVLVLELSNVPSIDATGIVNLRSTIERLGQTGIHVVLTGLQAAPSRDLRRAGLFDLGAKHKVTTRPTLLEGLELAATIAAELRGASQPDPGASA
ncbi:MAG: SulP family inorganic anion transporter [Planctomycetota bacterium]